MTIERQRGWGVRKGEARERALYGLFSMGRGIVTTRRRGHSLDGPTSTRRPATHLLCPAQSAQIVCPLMPFCKWLLEHTGEMLGQPGAVRVLAQVSIPLVAPQLGTSCNLRPNRVEQRTDVSLIWGATSMPPAPRFEVEAGPEVVERALFR